MANEDGYLYVYKFDLDEGGECSLLRQHRFAFSKGSICIKISFQAFSCSAVFVPSYNLLVLVLSVFIVSSDSQSSMYYAFNLLNESSITFCNLCIAKT